MARTTEELIELDAAIKRLAAISPVQVYANGMFCCSVCAPEAMTAEAVQAEVNKINPCGTEKGWTISEDTHFKGGQTMPCVCNDDPGRRHWLLDA